MSLQKSENTSSEIPEKPESELPNDGSEKKSELPDDSGEKSYKTELPDDSGNTAEKRETPNTFSPEETENEKETESFKNCPIEGNNGRWDGDRGNSKWCPDRDYTPPPKNEKNCNNPDKKTWGEILDKYSIYGIVFNDGEPDFSELSKGTVEIKDFSTKRDDNFDKADIELAKQRGCYPEEVKSWRKNNNYTWHECKDMKTMQKVPREVHNNVTHCGGVSEAKKGTGENE